MPPLEASQWFGSSEVVEQLLFVLLNEGRLQ